MLFAIALQRYDQENVKGESLGKTISGRMSAKVFNHLSAPAYHELCLELNAKRYPPTDWRLLMAELGLDERRYIRAFERGKEAGAVAVINLFFVKNKGEEAIEKLHAACRKVRLHRAIEIIEKDQPQLRLDNTSLQSIDNTGDEDHQEAQRRPDQQTVLPDVTQHSSPHSLSNMMSQMNLRDQTTEQLLLPCPLNNNNINPFGEEHDISKSGRQGIVINNAIDTHVQFGNSDMFPNETSI